MSANANIHDVTSVRVQSFTPWNNSAFTLEISHGETKPITITMFGSEDVMRRMVEAFGDDKTHDHTDSQPAS